MVTLKAIFCLLPPRRVFLFHEDPVNLIIRRLTCLFLSANGPSKRKSTSENPHQSAPAPTRIPSSRLRNQTIWAELLSGWVGSSHLTLQNAICPRAGARGGGCGSRPKWFRILSIAWRCIIAAIILNSLPQCAVSVNALGSFAACGTTLERHFAFGAVLGN
jgi:hypothetical protein